MNGFLIPANSKKSMLIFGLFNKEDLILISAALGISLILLLFLDVSKLPIGLIAITPGLVGSFLVFPIPNYHNMLTVIKDVYTFYTSRQKFIWKGWCFLDGESKK
ncbi:MAG TPA: hypothetical protein PLV83_00735 [Bacilli bacterium]|nr:hypothetical protein [Bacilli bacterium]